MTNKVKPFYIRITDDMTPQMVQDAFDKCHNLGVRASNNDDIENLFDWGYFGVCAKDGTYFSDSYRGFYDATEITLDQLDEWLGLEVGQEWKNGDECEYKDEDDEWSTGGRYVCYDDFASHHVFYATNMTLYHATSDQLRKPETPEQKAERERLREQEEARKNALEILEEVSDVKNANVNIDCTYAIAVTVKAMIELGYRKQ